MKKLLQAGLLAGIVLGIVASSGRAVDQKAIDKAIDKGVAALKSAQAADGTWRYQEIGATALAALTLLECGVPADDKAVLAAADAIRRASLTLTHNYSISLSILFFDRLGDPGDVPLIESLTVRLLAGQTMSGGWHYQSPPIGETEVRRLATQLTQRKELTGRREAPKRAAAKRTAKDLPREIQQQLAALNRFGGNREMRSDNSNTQFATLALWVARRHGLPVEPALKRIEARFRLTQNADGGWGYSDHGRMGGMMRGSSASMTCAGLLGLAVADGSASEKAKSKKPDPKNAKNAKNVKGISKDRNLRMGLLALSTAVGQPQGPRLRPGARPVIGQVGGRTYYFLWSLERVAVALDLKTIGKKDWYGWGAEIIVANQLADGSWQGNYTACGGDTCFALLFLKRANLALDLTTQLTGKLQDPGEKILKKGGVSGEGLVLEKVAELKPGLESKDAKAPVEGRYPEPIAKPLPPRPLETKPVDTAATRMAADLVQANGSRHTELLQLMRDGKGVHFTEALTFAIAKLSGERQRKVRDALVERLTRMKDKTLTAYFEDEQPEIRRAAALACARKGSKSLIPKLIPLLRQSQAPVVEGAHSALKDLTGEDFGPSAQKWLDWWKKQERK